MAGNTAIGKMNQQMDVDSIADLQDDMAENMQEVNERQELFAGAAAEGQDDILAELDELEAENVEAELAAMEVGNMPIAAAAASQPMPA